MQLGNLHDEIFTFWEKLMQRRIQQSDRDRESLHGPVQPDEVALLEREQARQFAFPILGIFRQDHSLHDRHAVLGEEHVLRTA